MKSSQERWLDELQEGVLLIEGLRVTWLNLTAARFLDVERERSLGAPLISVLGDHRLEHAALEGTEVEVSRGGRYLRARPLPGGLALSDVSAQRRDRESTRALLALLSHELRTPATTISSALEALRSGPSKEQGERFLDHAQAEAARLVRLLEDLTAEVKPPALRRMELAPVFERMERILGHRLAERSITVVREGEDQLVWADEDKLLQVLLNLVENAIQHGPADSLVSVTSIKQGDVVEVNVRDYGDPLPAQAFTALFEPHVRGSGRGGSGMGLYIVKSIVEKWGGRVRAAPLSDGNVFSFTVPAA